MRRIPPLFHPLNPSHALLLAASFVLLAAMACSLPLAAPPTLPAQATLPPEMPAASVPPATAQADTQPSAETQPPAATSAATAPAATAAPEAATAATEAITAAPQAVTQPPAPAQPQTLAFLRGGDVWLVEVPAGAPRQVTKNGKLTGFTWAADGSRLATSDGTKLCFVKPDGSEAAPCMDLGLEGPSASVPWRLVWSPDQKHIALWNPIQTGQEGVYGWIIVALDGSNQIVRVEDPVDFGAPLAPDNEPGGMTGEPVFLPDGNLIGTLTHRWLCGSAGCTYKLFTFNYGRGGFDPVLAQAPGTFSEGADLTLSRDGNWLADYGVFHNGCEFYKSGVDVYNLGTQQRLEFRLEQESVAGLALAPNGSRAILARTAGCNSENKQTWAVACKLSEGLDVYPLQIWDLEANQRTDVQPGLQPDWSGNGDWVAFQSCLAPAGQAWKPTPNGPPGIFVFGVSSPAILSALGEGSLPQWQP